MRITNSITSTKKNDFKAYKKCNLTLRVPYFPIKRILYVSV